MAEQLREKCAVAAIVMNDGNEEASALMYESLFAMQHRGAEASGMAAILPDGQLATRREEGMVRDVYKEKHIRKLAGSFAIGHNRYSTSGSKCGHKAPFKDLPIHFAFAENGNQPDTDNLEEWLRKHHVQTAQRNDLEMMGLTIAQNIRSGHDLPAAVGRSYEHLKGAFSCVALQNDVAVAFRDPLGIRPLSLGKLPNGYIVASETCGLDIVGAEIIREVEPGEMIVMTQDGIESVSLLGGQASDHKLDIFEFVYFARHDSYLYGESVNEVRRRFGEQLAAEHGTIYDNTDDVLVVPVPDTSIPVAEGYADSLGLKHSQAIIKNRYIGRTFMLPSQEDRHEHLRRKHNMVGERVKGRDIIMIDDSYVRGNTLPRLVELAYELGAKSVTALIGCPPIRFPDFYGIDTPSQDELKSFYTTPEQSRKEIGCHYLGFLSLSGMLRATGSPASKFNLSCFTGEYPLHLGKYAQTIKSPVSWEYID